jgi:hypothetical protein
MRKTGFRRWVWLLAAALAAGIAVPSPSQVGPTSGGPDPASKPPAPGVSATSSLFTYLGTEALTPKGNYLGAGFVRIYDAPTAGRLLVTFNTSLSQPEGSCSDSAHVYKEYTTDLQETGNHGAISCMGGADIGSLLVGNTYYLASMHREGEQQGWEIASYDATSWTRQVDIFRPVDYPREIDNDPMVAYVNGRIDFSSQYNASGTPPDLMAGGASFHLFFSTDLQFLEEKILADTPHEHGESMLFLDGIYYLLSANGYLGDLVVMKYDTNWNYLGVKSLRTEANFPEGLAYDGQRFYVAYMDSSLRAGPTQLPVSLNVRLAAFDSNWDLIEDIPVTNFTWSDLRQPGRPYLLLHGDRLYVSYDCDTIDPDTHQEQLKGQAYVAMFEIGGSTHYAVRRHLGRAETPCRPDKVAPTAVMRSTDHGATWTPLGRVCWHDPSIGSVDPTAIPFGDGVALYFIDIYRLGQPAAVPRYVYRALSRDGVNFDPPQVVLTASTDMVDPAVVRTADGKIRLYVPTTEGDTIKLLSAISDNGLDFTRDSGTRNADGSMPGALLLPDGQVRVFLGGSVAGQPGIFSKVSSDGLTFTAEDGLRIGAAGPADTQMPRDPSPIHLVAGGYLMSFMINPTVPRDPLRAQYRLANSDDGLTWTVNSSVFAEGGTSCLVERSDGTLYFYYGQGI